METFFASDLHIGHAGILNHTDRPWSSIEEHDVAIIDAWNATVSRGDEVWLLGDVFWNAAAEVNFSHMNGSKHLVVGNHDPARVRNMQWASVHDMHTFRRDGFRAVLCHFPMLTWDGAHRGVFMLHGHAHGNVDTLNESTTRLDVGIDTAARILGTYRPFNLEEVREVMNTRSYDPVDHHVP